MNLPIPGLLYVPLQQGSLSDAELNNWYNNQHAPARMNYTFFLTGYRYKQIPDHPLMPGGFDLGSRMSNKLALYEISDMRELEKAPYNTLLAPNNQSQRDHSSISKLTASRKYFDHTATYRAIGYPEGGLLREDDKTFTDGILIAVHVRLASGSIEDEVEFKRWYVEDHLPPLRDVPGWLRTRIYRTSIIDASSKEDMEFLTLNEFADPRQVGGPEHLIAIGSESKTTVVASKRRECWVPEFVLGRGPKDLTSLVALNNEDAQYVSPGGLIRTTNDAWPTIESSIFTDSFGLVEYCLEGRGGPTSHIIVLGTVCGLNWDVWDQFVSLIMKQKGDVRVLRIKLNPASQPSNMPVTSGAAFGQLELCVSNVISDLLLQPPVIELYLGMAGETVNKRFESCYFQNRTKLEHPCCTTSSRPQLRLAITAKSRMSIKDAILQLISALERSETMTQLSGNISQEIWASVDSPE
ncbi:uncharacterized protein A1O9_12310 [Exophiala aquamarina CBS 119918]|uniref:Uncharacterized protein n=1 Tax=Exophiala aquamarina CBS 119918 TaxID=1182545 RepID=A0A072P7T9_9EURO|nr:uncharacterized protein A1O9_12310 [Exophiala aquamarina CBS 119918]KEF51675.1 hypothetical protein A1O9_12310 [Exophiala aquamarina CBS 119918]